MIVVDSSVWIDAFRGNQTPQVILAEVLQGVDTEHEFALVLQRMRTMPIIAISSETVAIEAARNYRRLCGMGITVRKTIATLIATR